jgi:hypothetical protein
VSDDRQAELDAIEALLRGTRDNSTLPTEAELDAEFNAVMSFLDNVEDEQAGELDNLVIRAWKDLDAQAHHYHPRGEHQPRTARFLVTIAAQLMPQSERDRYLEEFRGELGDFPRNKQLWHALNLLRGVFVLRLRGGSKNKAADAVVRRVQE